MKKTDLDELIQGYQGIATSTLGHLTDTGYLPNIKAIHHCAEPLAGKILTVTLASDNTEIIKQALIEAEPFDILCIDARVLGEKACWGALRTCAAIYEKLTAVIVIGQVTDSLQIAELEFPVFALGVSSITTFKSEGPIGTLHEEIHYQGNQHQVTLRTGELALLDNDGVFVLSAELAQQLLPECKAKNDEDEMKFKLFLDAYRNDKLDELLQRKA